MAEEVKVFNKALEIAPHRGEVLVRDALLGAKFPHYWLNLGQVEVVHAWKEVVLDVVIDASVEPGCKIRVVKGFFQKFLCTIFGLVSILQLTKKQQKHT